MSFISPWKITCSLINKKEDILDKGDLIDKGEDLIDKVDLKDKEDLMDQGQNLIGKEPGDNLVQKEEDCGSKYSQAESRPCKSWHNSQLFDIEVISGFLSYVQSTCTLCPPPRHQPLLAGGLS